MHKIDSNNLHYADML